MPTTAPLLTTLHPIRKIVFLHIAKTGGVSVNAFFESLFGENRCATFVEEHVLRGTSITAIAESKDFISGHIYYEDIRSLDRNKFLIFTLLREPFAQLASHILWLDHLGDEERKETYSLLPRSVGDIIDAVRKSDLSNPESLHNLLDNLSPVGIALLDNLQTRYLMAPAGSMDPLSRLDVGPALINCKSLDFVGGTTTIPQTLMKVLDLSGISTTWPTDISFPHVNKAKSKRAIDLGHLDVRAVLATRITADKLLYERPFEGEYPTTD